MSDYNKNIRRLIIGGSSLIGGAHIVYVGCIERAWSFQVQFACPKCRKKITLRTGSGRYGNLGAFDCPYCRHNLYATIEDAPVDYPEVSIFEAGKQPHSLIDNTPRRAICELKPKLFSEL